MKIVYYSSAITGSGHIVIGISISNALKRKGFFAEYTILSSSSFAPLTDRFGIAHKEIPLEDENKLSKKNFSSSSLYKTFLDLRPDVLIVDLSWFMIYHFIEVLPCKKVFLSRQIADRAFHINLPEGRISFKPCDYDLVVKTEPFQSTINMKEINPIVIRNRDEILPIKKALEGLGVNGKRKVCLFAFNGNPGEFERIQRDYTYLEDVGYEMVYTTNYRGGIFPVVDYFNAVDLVICSAGYNAFWEVIFFEKEAILVPVKRRFESQEKRISECQDHTFEKNGADQLVELIEKL